MEFGIRGKLATGVLTLVVAVAMMNGVMAQERVSPARFSEVPTTGGVRPGPLGWEPPVRRARGVRPVAISIERAEVEAQVEQQEIVDGVMQNPSGPWVVSWYKETARLGEADNVVMAGHLDYWDVGPAVFYNLGLLVAGDEITVTGEDDKPYVYRVVWSELFETATAPIDKIVGSTDVESLTLITCGGPFDPITGEYLSRLVVRAERLASASR